MYFKFTCTHCDKSLKASPELAGRRLRCPFCKKVVTVPEPPAKPGDAMAALQEAAKDAGGGHKPHADEKASSGPRWVSAGHEWSNSTDINLPFSALIGLALAVLFYLGIVLPLRGSYLGDLFLERGWVQFVLAFLMGWSIGILVLKGRKVAKQRQAMLFDLLSANIAREITPATLEGFLESIRELPVKPSESFLISRVYRGLEYFRARPNTAEVAGILEMQSEMDANAVESSYTLLKVFVWAIPILGFIGTVMGISDAVGGFSGSLDKAQDITVLKESLNSVTSGLATAFDTTLVALVMSLLVTFPTSSMQKAEEDVLGRVDDYVNENLIKRLRDSRTAAAGDREGEVRQAVDQAMAPHLAELKAWREKLQEVGVTLTEGAVKAWREIHEQLRQHRQEDLTQWHEALARLAGRETDNLQRMADLTEKLDALHAQRMEDVDALTRAADLQAESTRQQLVDVVTDVRGALAGLVEGNRQVREETSDALRATAEETREYVRGLQEALRGLNDVLGALGEKQVVVTPPSRRRGWWPFGRGRGGA